MKQSTMNIFIHKMPPKTSKTGNMTPQKLQQKAAGYMLAAANAQKKEQSSKPASKKSCK